jgi:hypothetical protein
VKKGGVLQRVEDENIVHTENEGRLIGSVTSFVFQNISPREIFKEGWK